MEAPPHVTELANACAVAVHNSLSVELDFTQDTLPLLDHYIAQAKGPREEVLGLVAPMCGAYFGEVVRRSLGSFRWHEAGEDYPHYRLEHEHVFLHFNPIGVALEALLGRATPGWGANLGIRDRDREAVAKAVELYGDVREDDYYRFSVRFEVIEQALSALLAQAGTDATAITLGADVYALAIDDSTHREPPN